MKKDTSFNITVWGNTVMICSYNNLFSSTNSDNNTVSMQCNFNEGTDEYNKLEQLVILVTSDAMKIADILSNILNKKFKYPTNFDFNVIDNDISSSTVIWLSQFKLWLKKDLDYTFDDMKPYIDSILAKLIQMNNIFYTQEKLTQ